MRTVTRRYGSGLAFGVLLGIIIGLLCGRWMPATPIAASATQGYENFAIATGLADERIEAVYFLDYLTGELKCGIINPKTGKFVAMFNYNVAADFANIGAAAGGAKYLLVTGLADLPVPRGRGNNQFGKSIVYIAETQSGFVAAYTIQWNPGLLSAGRGQGGTFTLLDIAPFRSTAIRD